MKHTLLSALFVICSFFSFSQKQWFGFKSEESVDEGFHIYTFLLPENNKPAKTLIFFHMDEEETKGVMLGAGKVALKSKNDLLIGKLNFEYTQGSASDNSIPKDPEKVLEYFVKSEIELTFNRKDIKLKLNDRNFFSIGMIDSLTINKLYECSKDYNLFSLDLLPRVTTYTNVQHGVISIVEKEYLYKNRTYLIATAATGCLGEKISSKNANVQKDSLNQLLYRLKLENQDYITLTIKGVVDEDDFGLGKFPYYVIEEPDPTMYINNQQEGGSIKSNNIDSIQVKFRLQDGLNEDRFKVLSWSANLNGKEFQGNTNVISAELKKAISKNKNPNTLILEVKFLHYREGETLNKSIRRSFIIE